ncbi:MAG: serine/threonine protein kinase [Thermoanaerobaculia bacterium]|nr:serine/threonine protein kinase [Thermoanaerobaculia bacterium]
MRVPERIGKYLIVRKAGRGGFGNVYEGWDSALGRNVAIKVLEPRDDEDRRRFEREARVIAALGPQLPVVAQIYDFFSDPEHDLHYLVEEFLSGVDLRTKIEEGDRLPAELRLVYLDKIAYGLSEVHKRGVVHRDLKPGNVRVLHNHEIKLLDFGLAKVVGEDTLAEQHAGVGTPSYAAPEQSLDVGGHDGELVEAPADVFSLGVIAYELLTIRRPYEAANWPQYFELLRTAGPPPVTRYWPDCPADLDTTIMACLRRQPSVRPKLDEVRKVLRQSIRDARSLSMPPVAQSKRGDTTPATVRRRWDSRDAEAARIASIQVTPSRVAGRWKSSAKSRVSALARRVALIPWLVPTLILGVVLGVALGIGARSLVQAPRSLPAQDLQARSVPTGTTAESPLPSGERSSPPVSVSPPAAPALVEATEDVTGGVEIETIRFEIEATAGGTETRPTVHLRGLVAELSSHGDSVAYCQVERNPPWRLGELDQPRKRRDDCWRREEAGVVYEDVDVDPGTRYSYEVRLRDSSGRLLATSETADVLVVG